MRKTFEEVLSNFKVDVRKEYSKLYKLYYSVYYKDIQNNFEHFWFRKTCLTIEEFEEQLDLHFDAQPSKFDLDYLISFAEYIYNMMFQLNNVGGFLLDNNPGFMIDHINILLSEIGYSSLWNNNIAIFVKDNPASIEVSKIVSTELSYHILSYNHHSLKGNLKGKSDIILKIAFDLEPKRKQLEKIDSSLSSDLFFCFNKLNIRHNNKDKNDIKKYVKYVDDMASQELEKWYDQIYDMCLVAYLKLENNDWNEKICQLKIYIN